MNLSSALVLSTRKQATSFISRPIGAFMREAYRLVVSDSDIAEGISQLYLFEIFAVSYPEKAEGKGWGEPRMALEPHFAKAFSEDELVQFCEKHQFNINDGWQPVENDNA